MTAHKHAEMIKAKADNTDLVVFCKYDHEDEWRYGNFEKLACGIGEFFLCLPQHKEECLHWLNGGVAEQWCNTIWLAIDSHVEDPAWHKDGDFMDSEFKVRIKPRKEKRWIVAKQNSLASMMYFDSKELAQKAIDEPLGEFRDGQVIEIEVEVKS